MRAILIALGILFSTTTAQANFVEAFRVMQGEGASTDTLDAYLVRKFEQSTFGMSAFLVVSEGWGEAYVGPTFAPTDWLEMSASIGGEQTPEGLGLRYGAGLWVGDGPWSALLSLEANNQVFTGDDLGAWYDLTTMYQLIDWLKVGLRDRRFVGGGPHVLTSIPTTPLSVWATWTPFDPEGLAQPDPQRFLIGSQLAF